jgi:hypothetical protein
MKVASLLSRYNLPLHLRRHHQRHSFAESYFTSLFYLNEDMFLLCKVLFDLILRALLSISRNTGVLLDAGKLSNTCA